MFEQSVLDTAHRKSGALAISVTAQTIVVGILILIPLIYSDRLPLVQPIMPLTLPLSAPPQPEPVETSAAAPSPHASILPVRIFHMPAPASAAARPATGFIGSLPVPSSTDGIGVPAGIPLSGGIELTNILVPPPAPPIVASNPPEQLHAVGGDVQAAKLIRKVMPAYPPLARQARISGIVRLRGIIAKDGTIRQLQLIEGSPLLVRAAMEAVRQWIYKPTLLNGVPVEVVAPIDVIFTLSQ